MTNEIERGILKGYSGMNLFKEISDKILRDQQFLENIQAHRPDLIILDSTPITRMWTIIPYKLDIPFIFMGTIYGTSVFTYSTLTFRSSQQNA